MVPRRPLPDRTHMNYSIPIDVPTLDEGLKFYRDAMGLHEVARPIANYSILKCGDSTIGLMAKQAGTRPAKGSEDVRRYERHWTPVHIDFHVENFAQVLASIIDAGATCEQKFEGGDRPPTAFCSDPFGNGFCIIGMNKRA